jgi:hypothetical protein
MLVKKKAGNVLIYLGYKFAKLGETIRTTKQIVNPYTDASTRVAKVFDLCQAMVVNWLAQAWGKEFRMR